MPVALMSFGKKSSVMIVHGQDREYSGGEVVVIGASHLDSIIKLNEKITFGRTNSAQANVSLGGVAANIVRAFRREAFEAVSFVTAISMYESGLQAVKLSSDTKSSAIRVNAPPPIYTAILDASGELIIGAADMQLYEMVSSEDVMAKLPKRLKTLVMDGNFPEKTLQKVALSLPPECLLFVAGTSIEKVPRFANFLERIDAFSCNRAEAIKLTECVSESSNSEQLEVSELAQKLSTRLRDKGCALVSDGHRKAAFACDQILIEREPPSINLCNANGAGDVMAASFFGQLSIANDWSQYAVSDFNQLLKNALTAGAKHAAQEEVRSD